MQKGFQDELQSIRDEMQRKFGDVNKKIGNVQQTLFQEQMLIGQEFAGLQATLKTILDRLPAEVSHISAQYQNLYNILC